MGPEKFSKMTSTLSYLPPSSSTSGDQSTPDFLDDPCEKLHQQLHQNGISNFGKYNLLANSLRHMNGTSLTSLMDVNDATDQGNPSVEMDVDDVNVKIEQNEGNPQSENQGEFSSYLDCTNGQSNSSCNSSTIDPSSDHMVDDEMDLVISQSSDLHHHHLQHQQQQQQQQQQSDPANCSAVASLLSDLRPSLLSSLVASVNASPVSLVSNFTPPNSSSLCSEQPLDLSVKKVSCPTSSSSSTSPLSSSSLTNNNNNNEPSSHSLLNTLTNSSSSPLSTNVTHSHLRSTSPCDHPIVATSNSHLPPPAISGSNELSSSSSSSSSLRQAHESTNVDGSSTATSNSTSNAASNDYVAQIASLTPR